MHTLRFERHAELVCKRRRILSARAVQIWPQTAQKDWRDVGGPQEVAMHSHFF